MIDCMIQAHDLSIGFNDTPILVVSHIPIMSVCHHHFYEGTDPDVAERVLKMLGGTTRDSTEVIGSVPPDLIDCTVEKVAINAVLAGCKPEYMPVVLAAVEAALLDDFCMHGLLATTWFSGPIVVVNGYLADTTVCLERHALA